MECWSVFQILCCFSLCVSIAWVSLLLVIAGVRTLHLSLCNTYISQPSSESSCNAWTMYYWLQIRVARCRRRFHLKLLLAHGFLQTFLSFIQSVNAIGSYYVKICLICSEIHIWLENTVIFYQAFDDKYKQPRQIIWYRDHWTSNEVDNQTMKCLSRVLKCTAIFFSLEKDPSSFNFRTLPFMPLTMEKRICRYV